jgi:hypothetical protein
LKEIARLEARLVAACNPQEHSAESSVTAESVLSTLSSTTNSSNVRPTLAKPPAQVPMSNTLKKKVAISGRRKADSESNSDSEPVPPLLKYRYQIQEYGTDGFAEGEMRVDADLSEAQNQWRCSGKIPHGYQPNWGYKFAHEPRGKKAINFGNNDTKYQEILKEILQNHKDLHNKVAKTKSVTPLLIFDTTTKTVSVKFSSHCCAGSDLNVSDDQATKATKQSARLGRPNQPRLNGPSMPIYNKAGEVMFDMNDPDACQEADNLLEKRERIPTFVAQIEREFCCNRSDHHGVCWVAPPSHPEAGRHFDLNNQLRWAMAKLLVRECIHIHGKNPDP